MWRCIMKCNYVNQISDTRKEYVKNLIRKFPELYAVDGANNRLVKQYFIDAYNIEVPDGFGSIIHTLTRAKSDFLEDNPHLDKRVIDAGKNTPNVIN